jgi:RHS repeat-associated protein
LNRLTQKSFSDGATPTDKYGYDGVALSGCAVTPPALTDSNPKGRRTAMCDGAGAESWSHDTRGRTLTDLRTTNGVTKSAGYTYNFDGSIATLTYPSSRVVTYTLKSSKTNTAGRMLSAVDSTGPINYATAAAYAPHGALASVTNGANIISTFYFNDRLQPCRISVISSGKTPSNCADSARIGNVLDFTYSFNLGSDNSNVMGITNNRDNTRSQNFTYDSLNRLFTAQTQTSGVTIPNANCWGLTFGYDPWGNLLSSTISGPSGCGEPIPFSLYATNNNQLSTSSNQLAGYCYDAAGNLVLNSTCPIGSFTPAYSYNAASQLTSTAGVNYTYDGDGRRVIKSSGTIYWYGMSSDALDETDLAGDTNKSGFFEYVFFDGHRIARRDYQNNVVYYFSDHLGTSRVVSSSSGAILDDSDFYPFGAERPVSSSSGNHYKFTGKERDTDLDNFGARYDSSQLGRFMSSDQYSSIIVRQGMKAGGLPEAAADSFFNGFLDNPQNWNKYTYALNNPLRFVDPTGAAPQDGHHLFVERETLFQAGTLARDFANAIKTGPLSGNGYPNQPGFNELHQAYNDAVREMLNEAIQEDGPTEGWSLPQWKDFANSILNSQESAIKDFLDELEQYNPGARAALASSIASYRVSAIVVARIVATALVRSLFRILILCVNCDPASQQQLRERVTHRILPPSS